MIFFQILKQLGRGAALAVGALALAACATTDDTTNSGLSQAGGSTAQMIDAGDIAIAGQDFARSIRDLPQVTSAPKPPMVQFSGVTSIVTGPAPVNTDPYTNLLRDRLVLGCREKLRFVERELPPLVIVSAKKKKKTEPAPSAPDADYRVLAELRGNHGDDFYKIQMQFVDFHTGEVLFNGLYRIRKEAAPPPSDVPATTDTPAQNTSPASSVGTPVLQ